MEAYSLVNCLNGFFSIGIYTSLDNLYCTLNSLSQQCLKWGFSREKIKETYIVKKVYLDSEPLKFHEFSTYGTKIEIDWDKVFKMLDKSLTICYN